MIKRLILFFLINYCVIIFCDAQIRFNKRIVIDSLPKTINSIYPTDSCYYGIGGISDTINLLAFGNIFYKFDLEGNLLFEKRITNQNKTYEAWKQTKLNSLGELVSIGYTKDTSDINWKSWFVKYNLEGDTILTKEHISPNYNLTNDPFYSPLDFLETPDSGYIFIANTANTYKDVAVTRLDIDGNELWSKTYGNIYDDIVYNIISDGDNYIICGITNTNGLGSTSSTFSMYLFSIDIDGNELWSYVAPASEGIEIASDIIKAPDGGYFVAAYIETEIVGSSEYTVGSIAKLNENFEVEWHHPIYHEQASNINVLSTIVEEEIDTAFTTWGVQVGDISDTVWGIQPWMARVSVDGDSLWSRSYTFLGLESYLRHQFFDVRRTPDGGYIMCGESIDFSPDGSGDGQKGWLIKVDEYGCLVPGCHLDTSTDDPLSITQATLKVYPNPTSEYLNVYYKNKASKVEGFFRLVDIQGRVVFSFGATQRDTTYMIDLGNYSPGIYFLQYFEDGRLSKTEKIIIQK